MSCFRITFTNNSSNSQDFNVSGCNGPETITLIPFEVQETCVTTIPVEIPTPVTFTWRECYFKITNCSDPLDVRYISTDLTAYVGKIIRLGYGECFNVSVATAEEFNNPTEVIVFDSFDTCLECQPYYNLIDCYTGEIVVLNSLDVASFTYDSINALFDKNPEDLLNQNITALTIDDATAWSGCGYFEVAAVYPEVSLLWSVVEDVTYSPKVNEVFYKLTDCQFNNVSIYVTCPDLAGSVPTVDFPGNIVKIVGDTRCWTVSLGVDCCRNPATVEVVEVFKCYEDCDTCLPAPTSPKVIKQVSQTPGYNPGVCDADYLESVKCTVGEIHYKEILNKRFGIENCCPLEDEKWFIKNELLSLQLITDPNYC